MFLTLLDFTNRFTVSILRMFWWEQGHHTTSNSILKWGPTSSIGSSQCHHVKNMVFNVLCPNWRAYWGGLTSSYGVSESFGASTWFVPFLLWELLFPLTSAVEVIKTEPSVCVCQGWVTVLGVICPYGKLFFPSNLYHLTQTTGPLW